MTSRNPILSHQTSSAARGLLFAEMTMGIAGSLLTLMSQSDQSIAAVKTYKHKLKEVFTYQR